MISRITKSEDVLVVKNENDETVREFMKDTDSINPYHTGLKIPRSFTNTHKP